MKVDETPDHTHVQKSTTQLAINLQMFAKVTQKRWRFDSAFEWGTDGFLIKVTNRATGAAGSIIVSHALWDEVDWIHASIAYRTAMPAYADLVWLHKAVFGRKRWSFQVFTPEGRDHVSNHPNALHLWGRADGVNVLPTFQVYEGHI